jgi:hypothetical protein
MSPPRSEFVHAAIICQANSNYLVDNEYNSIFARLGGEASLMWPKLEAANATLLPDFSLSFRRRASNLQRIRVWV